MIPTSSDVKIQSGREVPAAADAVAVFTHKGVKAADVNTGPLADADRRAVEGLIDAGVVRGKSNEVTMHLVDAAAAKKPRRVIVLGLGNAAKFSAECMREAGATLAKTARKHRLANVAVVLPETPATLPGVPEKDPAGPGDRVAARAFTEGFVLGSFDYEEYKGSANKKKDDERPGTIALTIVTEDPSGMKPEMDRGRIVAEGQNFARTIASRPGNNINPPSLAKVAQDLAKETGLGIRVLDEKELKRLGMGGILAVGSGSSATPPRMIVLEYEGSGVREGKENGSKRASAVARRGQGHHLRHRRDFD